MRTKHTFLFTMLLGLAWTGYLFAYMNGPASLGERVSGVLGPSITCNQAGCHVGQQINAAGGTLSLEGLPDQWTPGATYPLTVRIQRTGANIYGFQLTAVVDSSNPPRQSGTLSKGATSGTDSTRISIINLSG